MNDPVHTLEPAAAPAPAPVLRPRRGRPRAEAGGGRDSAATIDDIIATATREFAEKGLAGARIDDIAEAMQTSKRMIYYYFGSKEGLYVRVLEEAYRRIRAIEAELHLADLPPEDALRRLVAFTHDYQLAHPDFVRLVMTENIHRGAYLAQSEVIQRLNVPAIEAVRGVIERGVAAGVFRAGVDPLDVHTTISALCFFNVANRHTFSLIFRRDPDSPALIAERRAQIVETVVRYLRA
jgi:AcrR family transcriptional regulator